MFDGVLANSEDDEEEFNETEKTEEGPEVENPEGQQGPEEPPVPNLEEESQDDEDEIEEAQSEEDELEELTEEEQKLLEFQEVDEADAMALFLKKGRMVQTSDSSSFFGAIITNLQRIIRWPCHCQVQYRVLLIPEKFIRSHGECSIPHGNLETLSKNTELMELFALLGNNNLFEQRKINKQKQDAIERLKTKIAQSKSETDKEELKQILDLLENNQKPIN